MGIYPYVLVSIRGSSEFTGKGELSSQFSGILIGVIYWRGGGNCVDFEIIAGKIVSPSTLPTIQRKAQIFSTHFEM